MREVDQVAVSTPVAGNGVVYVDVVDLKHLSQFAYPITLAAFRASDGVLLWQRPGPGGPLYLTGAMLLASGDGELTAFRASDGTQLWQVALSVGSPASMMVVGGVLYTLDVSGLYAVSAVRLSDGQMLWQVPPPSGWVPNTRYATSYPTFFGPVVSGGVLYFGTLNGPLEAVRSSDGTVLWQVDVVPTAEEDQLPS
jgi:outer membrane protein assembly factor BamB